MSSKLPKMRNIPFLNRRLSSARQPFDPSYRFATSWLLPPPALFAARVLISFYIFFTQFFSLGWQSTHGDSYGARLSFSLFTILTYWGLGFYFAFAAAHTASYWLRGRPWLASWPRALQALHSLFYSTVVVFPVIVTGEFRLVSSLVEIHKEADKYLPAVYWGVLAGPMLTSFSLWGNVSKHIFNLVFAVFEIAVPRTDPLPWLHLVAVVLILALYLSLAYLTYATEHTFVYTFLDYDEHSSGAVAGYIIAILAGAIVAFVIVRYVIWGRRWVTETKLGMMGKTSRRATRNGRAGGEEAGFGGENGADLEVQAKKLDESRVSSGVP